MIYEEWQFIDDAFNQAMEEELLDWYDSYWEDTPWYDSVLCMTRRAMGVNRDMT